MVAENVPLLIMLVLVAFEVFTAILVLLSIVTPVSIVTSDPSPDISNLEQFVEILTVEPDGSVQSAANRKFESKKPKMMARDILYIEKTYIFIELATTVANQVTQINNLVSEW